MDKVDVLESLKDKWRSDAADPSCDRQWRQARAEHADELEDAIAKAREAAHVDCSRILADARLRASIYKIIDRVEGAPSERWAAGSERLKDTAEWVAFYNAAHQLRNGFAGFGINALPEEWYEDLAASIASDLEDRSSEPYGVRMDATQKHLRAALAKVSP